MKNGTEKEKNASMALRRALTGKKQRNLTLAALISLAVFVVCGLIGGFGTGLSFTVGYLLLVLCVFGLGAAVTCGMMAFFEGRALRASMKRLRGGVGLAEAAAELAEAKSLCGGSVLLGKTLFFARGMGAAAPLGALRAVRLQAVAGKDQEVWSQLWATLENEKREVLLMREEVGFVNRGRCERTAAFLEKVVAAGGALPEANSAKADEDEPKAARATAKELRALLSALSAQGLPKDNAYALYLRRKETPEKGGLRVERVKDNRVHLFGAETDEPDAITLPELAETASDNNPDGAEYFVAREKAASLVREKSEYSFVLLETQENGRERVYRLTPEQFLQLDKALYEAGKAR